jgi:transposase InsO family protein
MTAREQTPVFPWVEPSSNQTTFGIKWQIGKKNYEVYHVTLADLQFQTIIPHILSLINMINQVVVSAQDRGESLYQVLPRTLNTTLANMWFTMMTRAEQDDAEDDEDKDKRSITSFHASARAFIALVAEASDQHDLYQQLTSRNTLPRDLDVNIFYQRLLTLNSYIDWMPGRHKAMSDEDLKTAFHDAMPIAWQNSLEQANEDHADMTINRLVSYMRHRQKRAKENQDNQNRRDKMKNNAKGTPKAKDKEAVQEKSHKRQTNGKRNKGQKKQKIEATDHCPIHPNGLHTWGECFQNALNPQREQQQKKKKASNYKKSETSDANVVSDQANKTNQGASVPPPATSNCFAFSTSTPDTHHLNALSYDVPQTNEVAWSPEVEDAFTMICQDAYSIGAEESIKGSLDVEITKLVKAISYAFGTIQGIPINKPMKVLFDNGSDYTMCNRRAIPTEAVPTEVQPRCVTGLGTQQFTQEIHLTNLTLPEFSPTKKVPGPIKAYILDNPDTKYDIILGMDTLTDLGIDIHCSTRLISWGEDTIYFKPLNHFDSFHAIMADVVNGYDDPAWEKEAQAAGYKSRHILQAKYEKANIQQVVDQQHHLTQIQKDELRTLLNDFEKLFSGKLGRYPHRKIHLDLQPNAPTYTCRPYPVPRHHRDVFRAELKRLEEIGVLEKIGASPWLFPSFTIPKKDGTVRWISDFRELNKLIKRRVYNLPRIQDILTKRTGYKFFSKLDISMQYYTFELDEASQNVCCICTPEGNYRYKRLPMGVCQSPDIAQEIMEDLFRALDEVDVYIDDVGVFNDSWQSHLLSLRKVLALLQDSNFTVNPLKCGWAVQETDWLGYWLTPTGLKPWQKKVKPILALQRPTTPTQLRSFLGAVNFYRDMYPRRSHILAPLTKLAGLRGKLLPWTDDCQQAFDQMKALLAEDAFLRYPDHNKPFHIYCDASDLQLGAAIFQEDAPVAYYSRKLTPAQRNYTVGEREMLSMVETLKEFHTMLYGSQHIHIYTDHKNNTFQRFNTQRVIRWRLFLEDYGVQLHYIKGSTNGMADALSRLPFEERALSSSSPTLPTLHSNVPDPDVSLTAKATLSLPTKVENRSATATGSISSECSADNSPPDCFVTLPATEGVDFELTYPRIAAAQERDAGLRLLRQKYPEKYVQTLLAPGIQLTCFLKAHNDPLRIYLPEELLSNAIRWYHLALGHIGQNRLCDTMALNFHHPALRDRIDSIVSTCDSCQRNKQVNRGHGTTAGREAGTHPWREIAVDTIGPWTLKVAGITIPFYALTIIDIVTNLVELVRLDNTKTSAHVALMFDNTWLSRYPRPMTCIHDQGGEFTGYAFQQKLQQHQIKARPITAKNPQANAICERMHQVIGNTLRTLSTAHPPDGITTANRLVDTALAMCMYATRAAVHSGLKASPGSLAFSRDMILDLPFLPDWNHIQESRQQLIDHRLLAANSKRFSHDYRPGEEVLKLLYNPQKLQSRATGPFRIDSVHTNGTVTIRLTPQTIERISIRRIKPYKREG